MLSNKCFVNYSDDGICHGSDEDGVKTIDSMEKVCVFGNRFGIRIAISCLFQIGGDWWVIGGLNCGKEPYPGGYDWYPCQHERFIYLVS